MLISVIRPIPQAAIDFIKAREGCRLTAYLDVKGVPTIGYGHTGHDVHLGLTIDQATAERLLAGDLASASRALESKIGETCLTELTDNQYSALLSFVFNLGTGDPNKPEWTIWRLLRAQQFDQIPSQIVRFVYAGGNKLTDLVERRADEVKLWSTDEPGSIPQAMSSGVTRSIDTPPADAPVKPLSKSKSMIAGCLSACLAGASSIAPQIKSGVDGINSAISPYVGQSTVLQGLSSHLALVAAAAAVAVPLFLWLQHRAMKTA